jgi:mannose-6-phosphate isomerase-like protein (cupin superfamily)
LTEPDEATPHQQVINHAEFVRVYFAVLSERTSIPKHPAGREQVFFVVSGEGRVAGHDDVEHPVRTGQAVTWARLEPHTTWADTDMAAVIVERTFLE